MLSLLQTRRDWSGTELADRLDITTRTVRRDVDRLRDLGYPIDGAVGVGGGYRLGAGAEMPPLLLADDEVLAVAIGLQSGATGSVTGLGEASLQALTKLRQVMPSRLRHRLDALDIDVLDRRPASSVDAATLTAVATVCHAHERLRFDYTTHDGASARREVEPYRLVRAGSRWYLVAWDISREDWRSFRVDRMEPKIPSGPRFVPRELPPGGAAHFVATGIDRAFAQARARVTLHASVEEIAPLVDPSWGILESVDDDTCEISLSGTTMESIARWLAAFDVDFAVIEPEELRAECRLLAERHSKLSRRYLQA